MPSNKGETKMIVDNQKRGSVSLFIVIFTALLITVVAVGFVSIMVQDQQQASTADLSQSAYDSAQAGIEDAKRALIRYQTICNADESSPACATVQSQIDSQTCNSAVETLRDVTVSGGEVAVQTNSANNLDQAYTCTKINLDTDDYLGSLSANNFNLIPLTGVGAFDTVQIQWFSSSNLNSGTSFDVNLQDPTKGVPLLLQGSWSPNRPSLMQAQLVQFGSNGFTLDDFNSANASDQSDANTLFLYPTGTTGTSNSTIDTYSFVNNDIRRTGSDKPLAVMCTGTLASGGYACTVNITMPTPINGGDRTAFLQLSALYNNSNYRITLLNGGVPVKFNAVQPEVDSTGRTNDLFRRVQARVVLFDANFPFPEAAVNVTGSVCKDFIVTDNVADYQTTGCAP
jgi:hypothetical protein